MQVMYQQALQEPNTAPTAGLQFFGQVDIDAKIRTMTVTHKDLAGSSLYAKTLVPTIG
jgi:alkaline phosphatase D